MVSPDFPDLPQTCSRSVLHPLREQPLHFSCYSSVSILSSFTFLFFVSYLNPVSLRILLALKYTQALTSSYQPHCYRLPSHSPRSRALLLLAWMAAAAAAKSLHMVAVAPEQVSLPFPWPSLLGGAWYVLHRVDALRKTHRRFLDDSPSLSLPKAPSQNENQTLTVLCKACSSPVFSSVYSSLTLPQTCDTASQSPGPAVSSGGHLACTPTIFWPLFRLSL